MTNDKINILIVDPEPHIGNLIRLYLNNNIYAVDCCYKVIDALKMVKKKSYDIIITELVFSGINGYELIVELRKKKKTRFTPIMVLSYKGQMTDKLHAIDCGADDYMTKPFDPKELEIHIKLNLTILKK